MREAFAIRFERGVAVYTGGHVAEVRSWERLSCCGFELENVDGFRRTRDNALNSLLGERLSEWKKASQQGAAGQEFQKCSAVWHCRAGTLLRLGFARLEFDELQHLRLRVEFILAGGKVGDAENVAENVSYLLPAQFSQIVWRHRDANSI